MSSDKHQRRIQRIEKEVQEVLARYIISHHSAIGGGALVTITRVDMTSDLRSAKVLVSIFGDAIKPKQVLENLEENRVEMQEELNHQLELRYCPKLSFELDTGFEKSMAINQTLRKIKYSEDGE